MRLKYTENNNQFCQQFVFITIRLNDPQLSTGHRWAGNKHESQWDKKKERDGFVANEKEM